MASKTNKKAEQKQKMVRIVAVVACAALLLTAILPYARTKIRRFRWFGGGAFFISSSCRKRAFVARQPKRFIISKQDSALSVRQKQTKSCFSTFVEMIFQLSG